MINLAKKYVGLLCLAVVLACIFQGCKNEPAYKPICRQVMKLHDKVMGEGEKSVKNRMMLNAISLIKLKEMVISQHNLDTLAEQKKIAALVAKLNQTDDKMVDWINSFQYDIECKSNAEIMKYLQIQVVHIKELDDQYKKVLNESDTYLKKFNLEHLN